MLDEPVTAEVAVELPEIVQVCVQLGANRLRPIHQFRCRRIEFSHFRNLAQPSGNVAVSISLAMRPSNSGWNDVLVP